VPAGLHHCKKVGSLASTGNESQRYVPGVKLVRNSSAVSNIILTYLSSPRVRFPNTTDIMTIVSLVRPRENTRISVTSVVEVEVIRIVEIIPHQLSRLEILERSIRLGLFRGQKLMHDFSRRTPQIVVRH